MRDFNHTVNVLVQAYLNDTLEHGICTACAVGNIIANSIGCKIEKDYWDDYRWTRNAHEIQPIWQEVFSSLEPKKQRFDRQLYNGWHKKQIDSSGYTIDELARIEFMFESIDIKHGDDDYNSDEHKYLGLMAVVDVLADIHGIDLTQKEEAKKLFVKA